MKSKNGRYESILGVYAAQRAPDPYENWTKPLSGASDADDSANRSPLEALKHLRRRDSANLIFETAKALGDDLAPVNQSWVPDLAR